ncbi:MAG: CoA-binding protein, partial [Acidobacteriaceae bacterium]|nr:CoA-binding protein [Acidobacteriaceae bacterium]
RVNPKRAAILGSRAYPSVSAIPEPVDLAVIVTPAESVPNLMAECTQAGVTGAVIISAGFRETGSHAIELERQTLEVAWQARIRLIRAQLFGCDVPDHQYGPVARDYDPAGNERPSRDRA